MNHRALGRTGLNVSVLALGGHEYHPDGRLRGIGDDLAAAVRPCFTMGGFGGPARQALVQQARRAGINYFDATIDPEVEALGRSLRAVQSGGEVIVQCRPQGMCYRYDPGNPGLVDLPRLRAEVRRLISLVGRSRIDVLNFGIEAEALAASDYLQRLAVVIATLKQEGLIQFAACDSLFSGTRHYLTMMRSGCFDLVWLNFGPLCASPAAELFPAARAAGMAVVAREAFTKGTLFRVAATVDPALAAASVARAAIRWILSHPEVSSLAVGTRNQDELANAVEAAAAPPDHQDRALLDRLRAHEAFAAAAS